MIVKICGITTTADAELCASLGVDMIGLNFWPSSKRFISPELAGELAAAARTVRPETTVVGVFVNPTDAQITAADAACNLDLVQLHGDEDAARVIEVGKRGFKALSVASSADVDAAMQMPGDLILLDTPCRDYGGSGQTFDWSLCAPLRDGGRPWLLAGGLEPSNVALAIAAAAPTGVDVASGVEAAPGNKDHEKVRAFVRAARGET